MNGKTIILSRTDSIGDVILTLPMAGVLKELYPACKIIFLGRGYTEDVIMLSDYVDHFINWDLYKAESKQIQIKAFRDLKADILIHVFPRKEIAEIARKAGISIRVGTTNRIYHWIACNRLIRLSRKRSSLHETQLNLKLITNLGAKKAYFLSEIPLYYGFHNIPPLVEDLYCLLSQERFNLVLHPKSKGSAREWGLNNFSELIEILPRDQFEIFITGTKEEGILLKESLIEKYPHITDLTGQLSLEELMAFIAKTDGLIAASTGPLHIAAALGKIAIGIYPPLRPMHPGRWAPVGEHATFIVADKVCNKCRKNGRCECMEGISPENVKTLLLDSCKMKYDDSFESAT
ncbi:glycosyltransferase family 9 protein [Bacteroidota bacterium]